MNIIYLEDFLFYFQPYMMKFRSLKNNDEKYFDDLFSVNHVILYNAPPISRRGKNNVNES